MKKGIKIVLIFFGMIFIPNFAIAQVDFNKTPDNSSYKEEFQEHFFEALKQKGIENYDRAVAELQKCIELDDSEPTVYFELGKNYAILKNFGAAEEALKEAIKLDPENEWFLDALYGIYVQLNDYDNSLKTVKKLIKHHIDYKHDLAVLYFENRRYRLALKTLDELDEDLGFSKQREVLRNKIYNATGDDKDRIEYLKERIEANPNIESNYLNLIYRYSQRNKKEKAFEVAKKLLEVKPNSHLVHLALYKFYLDEGDTDKAIESMKIVTNSPFVKADAKAMVLNDFVRFVKDNPQYEGALLDATTSAINDTSGKSNKELGFYYLKKGDKAKALDNFQIALNKSPDNFELIKNILVLQIELKKYDEAVTFSKEALEIYPSQPIFYLANGVANNHLNRPKDAIDALELGVDYIIDDKVMEIDFYKQLSIAYKLSNNITKANAFDKKVNELLKDE